MQAVMQGHASPLPVAQWLGVNQKDKKPGQMVHTCAAVHTRAALASPAAVLAVQLFEQSYMDGELTANFSP
jgi:hypothetical protein